MLKMAELFKKVSTTTLELDQTFTSNAEVLDDLNDFKKDIEYLLFLLAQPNFNQKARNILPQHNDILFKIAGIYKNTKNTDSELDFKKTLLPLIINGWLMDTISFIENTLQNQHGKLFSIGDYKPTQALDLLASITYFIENLPVNVINIKLNNLLLDLKKSPLATTFNMEKFFADLDSNYEKIAIMLKLVYKRTTDYLLHILHMHVRESVVLNLEDPILPQLKSIAKTNVRVDIILQTLLQNMEKIDIENNIYILEKFFLSYVEDHKSIDATLTSTVKRAKYHAQGLNARSYFTDGLCAGAAYYWMAVNNKFDHQIINKATSLENHNHVNQLSFNQMIFNMHQNQDNKITLTRGPYQQIKIRITKYIDIKNISETIGTAIATHLKTYDHINLGIYLIHSDALYGHAIAISAYQIKDKIICKLFDANYGEFVTEIKFFNEFNDWFYNFIETFYFEVEKLNEDDDVEGFNKFTLEIVFNDHKKLLHEELIFKNKSLEVQDQLKRAELKSKLLEISYDKEKEIDNVFNAALTIFESIHDKTETDKIMMLLIAEIYKPFSFERQLTAIEIMLKLALDLQATNRDEYSWNALLATIHIKRSLIYAISETHQTEQDISNRAALQYLTTYNLYNNDEINTQLLSMTNELVATRSIEKLHELLKFLNIEDSFLSYVFHDDHGYKLKAWGLLPQKIYDFIIQIENEKPIHLDIDTEKKSKPLPKCRL